MRPASVIFLVLSLVLIITGSVICGRAEHAAEKDGFNLLEKETDADGNTLRTYPITQTDEESPREVVKLAVKLKDAEVEIKGGQKSSKVEVYNKGAVFNCYVSNKVMTVSNIFDLAEMIESSGSNFEFNGIRKYMDFSFFETKQLRVVISLCDTDPMNQIQLKLDHCTTSVKNLNGSLDIIADVNGGELTMEEIQTNSMIQITGTKSTVNTSDLLFAAMNVDFTDCRFELDESNYGLLYPIGYSLSIEDSDVTVNGSAVIDSSFSFAPTFDHHFEGKVKGGVTTLVYPPSDYEVPPEGAGSSSGAAEQ